MLKMIQSVIGGGPLHVVFVAPRLLQPDYERRALPRILYRAAEDLQLELELDLSVRERMPFGVSI
jgi:hypothetical protein